MATFSFAVVPSDSRYLRRGYCRTLCATKDSAESVKCELNATTSIRWKIVAL